MITAVSVVMQAVGDLEQFNTIIGDSGRFAALTIARNEGRVLLLVP